MKSSLLLFVVSSLLMMGCTTVTPPPAHFSYGIATTGDFSFLPASKPNTYSWKSDAAVAHVSEEINAKEYISVIQSLIDQELSNKGFVKVAPSQSPQMWMEFGIATESKMTDDDIFASTQISTGIQVEAGPGENGEKGSLYIAAFAPLGDFPRWRVLAQGPTERRIDDPELRAEMEQIIGSMMKNVPTRL
ncbi:DUF4136 domain-containing protein [Vibrio methylphosphonaticus]|uniref:DUF4136 domain-containing protein n=1 Tax=Vibrio methylphosphonaticus TaxID=2946866 RepID=UPI00202A2969|nr:DUF4136 domain-containing protein [Vibrio methylphosphonaticus]MCL9776882.1 DUF4136 domain-containing protein [Vibrio methylphosphonaticus]